MFLSQVSELDFTAINTMYKKTCRRYREVI